MNVKATRGDKNLKVNQKIISMRITTKIFKSVPIYRPTIYCLCFLGQVQNYKVFNNTPTIKLNTVDGN